MRLLPERVVMPANREAELFREGSRGYMDRKKMDFRNTGIRRTGEQHDACVSAIIWGGLPVLPKRQVWRRQYSPEDERNCLPSPGDVWGWFRGR